MGLSNDHVLPTLSQVNAQQVLWQKCCDHLLDGVLCNHCIDNKDNAVPQGKGMDWIPDNCDRCKTVRRIFEQITYREWQEPLCQWWAANHVGLESHFQWSSLIQTFFNFRLCRWPFIRVAPKVWIRMWNIYVTSIVINAWCWSHPVTLVHGPSHPDPGQHWIPPPPPSPRWFFDWVALLAIPSPYSFDSVIITWSRMLSSCWLWDILMMHTSMS